MATKKLMIWTVVCALGSIAQPVFAQDSQNTPEKSATVSTTVTAASPKDACSKIVDAAKKDDFNAFRQLTLGMGDENKDPKKLRKVERGFHHMHRSQMTRLKDLKCGDEKRVENHAWVESEVQGEKRLIPFVKQGDSWKFDARTYLSFYRESLKGRYAELNKLFKDDSQMAGQVDVKSESEKTE